MKFSLRSFASLALCLTTMPTLAVGPTAPPLPEAKPEKKQGLVATFTAAGKTDSRVDRLIALFVPAGQAPTPFLPAGLFTARWETEITSELRAEYTFTVTTSGVATATLNGAPLLDSRLKIAPQPVQLQKGANKLVVEFQSPTQGDAMLRLSWSSKEFPSEPVPPTVFQYESSTKEVRLGERLREGRLLFAQNRCVACHDAAGQLPPKGEGMPELTQDAPIFDAFGEKFQEAWLAAWINDPHSIRPHALMPQIFTGGEAGKIDQRAADLAAYLVTLGTAKEEKPLDASLADAGSALFANLGCIACHTKPDADGADAHDRVPLSHVKAKWHASALIDFLKDPARTFPSSRMPHFRLNDQEAKQLATFLLTTANREFPAGPKGDATRGAQLLATSNCLNCHANVPPTSTPSLAAVIETGLTKGCLVAEGGHGKAPDFSFSGEQHDALVAFLAHGLDSLKQDAPAEYATRQIKNLRCNACHTYDGQPGVWSQLEEEVIALQSAAPLEEGEGKPIHSTALPALTWFGEKLRPDYLATFIAGHSKDKPRPWIVGRMPGFAHYAEPLSKGLSLGHGFSLTLAPEAAPDAEKIKAGETLLGENGGFNCIQCHTLGDRAATAVFEAPGPNLALVPQRLRREYYHRWVLAPMRLDPETKMPKFADEEGKTPLTDFFDGQAEAQFDAIWQYLQTLKK